MPDSKSQSNPGLLADRYRVQRRIGAGAHATTWLAWDERLDRSVAVKMLHPQLAEDPVFVQRFKAEAKAAASVRQTNVVDVYDFGQSDGQLYIIMQFVDGEDLKSLIAREAPLTIERASQIIGNVLDGLQAIHTAGIVHRDIKPQNVLVGRDGVARVTDFGVADVGSSHGLTAEGFTIGTVDYMAPEQAQGLPLTASADVYASGVMLYEMLTATLPFRGDTPREVMLGHINGQLVPPSVRLPGTGINSMLDAVIAQSMAKDPHRRFGSANAMKQALAQAANATDDSQRTAVVQRSTQGPQRTAMAPRARSAEGYGARRITPAPPPEQYEPEDTGSGLNGALMALLTLLLIGALGIAAWAGFQFLDGDGIDLPFNIPGISRDQDETPVATDPPAEQNPPPAQNPEQPPVPTQTPIEVVPTDPPIIEPAPTDPPTQQPAAEPPAQDPDEDLPVIELFEPEPSPTDVPAG